MRSVGERRYASSWWLRKAPLVVLVVAPIVLWGCVASETGLHSGKAPFEKDLNWLSYRFHVRGVGDTLTLKLEVDTYSVTVDGDVMGADVGDLNRDGYPEVLVYLSSPDRSRFGSILGYSYQFSQRPRG